MTHIFVVNEQTFKVHLEYMFAGTGYSTYEPDFIDKDKQCTKSDSKERTFVSMIADISKLRIGDLVAFYVTGCKKIFGFFRVASSPFFVPKKEDYLGGKDELNRYLPFRVKLKPYLVYSNGITEHQALDNIHGIDHPYEMCWSLIYRKLTGMRGCSFVTDDEYMRLHRLITYENKTHLSSKGYSYDGSTQTIIPLESSKIYLGNTDISLNIKDRFLKVSNSHEVHLQAYITQNLDKGILKKLLYPDSYVSNWIGNEVVCSVGEQRIDVLTITKTRKNCCIRIIELKDETPHKYIVEQQLKWYIMWVIQYLVPNLSSSEIIIKPTIIAENFKRRSNRKTEFLEACENFNNKKIEQLFKVKIEPVEFISFNRNDENISFEKVF